MTRRDPDSARTSAVDGRRLAWNRYRDAAVGGAMPLPDGERPANTSPLLRLGASRWFAADPAARRAASGRWRDLRLVPLGAAAWIGAALAPLLTPPVAGYAALALAVAATACVAALAAATGVALHVRDMRSGGVRDTAGRNPRWPVASTLVVCASLSFLAGLTAGAGHGAAAHAGPVGSLLVDGGPTTATVQITGEPSAQRPGGTFSSGPHFAAPVRLVHATSAGQAFTASVTLRLIGGAEVERLRTGTTVMVAGRIVPAAHPGSAALLKVTGHPRVVDSDRARELIGDLRASLRESAQWMWTDAAGLLPGITVGDTSALPADLEDAMRDVGLGHLTAVSGANFTLLLGAVLLGLRAMRASRLAAALGCAAALLAFTIIVGPEPSVVRAAAMGAVGLIALLSGRAGRSCSAVSAAVLVLVLLDPPLALSMGFLLSVAATLGISLIGPALTQVLATRLPGWCAMVLAVPLSAQLTCGPLIVLIQPSFLTLSLAANLAVAPFVPFATVAGTLALATCSWCPPAAFLATAVGGTAAQAVADVARILASLPGATLPWPEGVGGAAAMMGVSALNAGFLCAILLPSVRLAVLTACLLPVHRLRSALVPVRRLGRARSRGRVDG
ncbi:hypothetical protein GCM10027449_30430 [Sinomonas notoginsengisoli]|uniref:ComEC/Rec2 family competence protein n=1 Tax=Sinomonas notoginsengisoli TaxID=1457311 RepID=UPI001F2E5E85|nr:ComEC/Rec2 family competence protein [Sinomonas notoginsengisoli]